jgi:serine protease AprX
MTHFSGAASALFAALFLVACGGSSPLTADLREDDDAPAPISPRVAECDAVYGGPGDVGLPRETPTIASALQALVQDPVAALQPVELLLTFNSFRERDTAFRELPLISGVTVLENKLFARRFERLPIISLQVPALGAGLLEALSARFSGRGLLSIYPREAQTYYLNETRAGIGSAAAAEDFGADGTGIGVVIVDSGTDGTHPDLAHIAFNAKAIGLPSLVSTLPAVSRFVELANTDTTSGHGTHVSGTVGGRGVLLDGKYVGTAPDATLVSLGSGDAILVLFALEAFDFLLNPDFANEFNIRVTNNSYGGGSGFDAGAPDAVAHRLAWQAGIVNVFAAGNSGSAGGEEVFGGTGRQSNGPCVISVGSVDRDLQTLTSFSSRGDPDDPLTWPDILAPGRSITATRGLTGTVSTDPVLSCAEFGTVPPCAYATISGTSMASPHIAGVVAQMLEVNPKLDQQGVLDILRETAVPMAYTAADPFLTEGSADGPHAVGDPYPAFKVGAGRVDAYAAVQLAKARVDSTPAPTFFFPDPNATPPEQTVTPITRYSGSVGLGVCDPSGLVGACVAGTPEVTTFEVPAGFDGLRVTVSWLLPTDDLDVAVTFEDRTVAVAASLDNPEIATVLRPEAGTYRLRVSPFLNTPTSYDVVVEGLTTVSTP